MSLTLAQPTITLALSTTFTPPAACTSGPSLNLFPARNSVAFWNEPVPLPLANITANAAASCYPSEFLAQYTAVPPRKDASIGSSVVPAMSSLVCPKGWCTAFAGAGGYAACCPDGFTHITTSAFTAALSTRPAYGALCVSVLPSQPLSALLYPTDKPTSPGSASTSSYTPRASNQPIYAHPIDGWAPSGVTPSVGCRAPSSSSKTQTKTKSKDSSNGATKGKGKGKKGKKKVKGGALAGIIVGALVAVVLIIALVVILLKKRKEGKEGAEYEKADAGEAGGVTERGVVEGEADVGGERVALMQAEGGGQGR